MPEHLQAEIWHVLFSRYQIHIRHGSGNEHIFNQKSRKLHGIWLLSSLVGPLASAGHGRSILAQQEALHRRAVTNKLVFVHNQGINRAMNSPLKTPVELVCSHFLPSKVIWEEVTSKAR